MKKDFPDLRKRNIFGMFTIHGDTYGANGLVYYVGAKLLWNSALDVDALVWDYCEKAYGKAASPMHAYYERLERAAIESGVHLAYADPEPEIVAIFTPKVLADMQRDLDRAVSLSNDEVIRSRIAIVGRTFEYTKRGVDYLRPIDAVARRSPLTGRWIGARFTGRDSKTLHDWHKRAAALRSFLEDPRNQSVSGVNAVHQTAERPGGHGLIVNSYVENMLRPKRVLRYYRALLYPENDRTMDKASWLASHPSEVVAGLHGIWFFRHRQQRRRADDRRAGSAR